MKKIAVVIMFFSFCGGADETIEPLTTTTTLQLQQPQEMKIRQLHLRLIHNQ